MKRIAMPLLGALFLSLAGCGSDSPGSCQGDSCGGSGGSTGGSGGGAGGGGGSSAAIDHLELRVDGKAVTGLSVRDTDTVKVEAVAFDASGKVVSPMPSTLKWEKTGGTMTAIDLSSGVPMASVRGTQDLCKAGTMPKDPRVSFRATIDGKDASAETAVAFSTVGIWDVTSTVPGYPPSAGLIVVKEQHGTTIVSASGEGSQGTVDGLSGEIGDGQFKLIKKNPASGKTSYYTGTLSCDGTIKGKTGIEGEVMGDFTMKHR